MFLKESRYKAENQIYAFFFTRWATANFLRT